MEFRVRRVRPDDGPRYRDIRRRALTDTPTAFGSTWAEESRRTDEEWTGRAERGSSGALSALFVAEDGEGRWVGMAGGYYEDDPPSGFQLVSMWVAPEHRRTGLGGRLVDEVLAWAAAAGARTVDLWVTRGNDRAASLYRRLGFVPTADYQPLPSDPCKDEERMRLELPAPTS